MQRRNGTRGGRRVGSGRTRTKRRTSTRSDRVREASAQCKHSASTVQAQCKHSASTRRRARRPPPRASHGAGRARGLRLRANGACRRCPVGPVGPHPCMQTMPSRSGRAAPVLGRGSACAVPLTGGRPPSLRRRGAREAVPLTAALSEARPPRASGASYGTRREASCRGCCARPPTCCPTRRSPP